MRVENQKGYTIIGTMIIMMIMSYMGINVADVADSDSSGSVREVQATQALYVGNGGIQYALKQLDEGLDPVGTRRFGEGEFTVRTDPNARGVFVSSLVGPAVREQSLLVKFSRDKTDLDLRESMHQGNEIKNINLLKTEGGRVILTHLALRWNWSDCGYNDACEAHEPVYVCHIPNGDESKRHTIRASQSSLESHLAHGDREGKCDPDEVVRGRACDGSEEEVSECYADTGGQHVSSIAFNGTSIFNGSAASGDKIDIDDQILTADGTYAFDYVRFSGTVPQTGWYSLTMYFSDGSERTSDFKFINQMIDADDDRDDFDDD